MAKQPTTLEKIKELEERTQKLKTDAKQEALARANEAIGELRALGFDYKLASSRTKMEAAKGSVSDEPCPICKFKTDPPHDGRKHRGTSSQSTLYTSRTQRVGV